MITLYDVLTQYCASHGKKIPAKQTRCHLGHLVAQTFKDTAPGQKSPKVESKETVQVNGYPDDFRPRIEEMLQSYFNGDKTMMALMRYMAKAAHDRPRSFNHAVMAAGEQTMEKALTHRGLAFTKKPGQKGMVNFRITYKDSEDLIYLGMQVQRQDSAIKEQAAKKMVL